MTVYDAKTGQPVEVDEKAAAAGILSGQYGVPQGARMPIMRSDGTVGTIPSENLPKALQAGWALPSEQQVKHYQAEKEYGGLKGMAIAGATGVGRGLTLGLSDLALDRSQREAVAAAREANPITSGVGEAIGTAGGLLLAPEASGPGLITKAGEAAGRTATEVVGSQLLGRLATKGATGAVEGGLYGLGQFVSDSALSEHPELDAEKLFAAMGGGALTGGFLNGSAELFTTGARKAGDLVMSKLGGKGLRQALSDFAEQRALSTVAIGSDAKRFGLQRDAERSVIGRYMLDKLPLTAGDNAESIMNKAAAASDWHGANIGAITEDIDKRAVPFDTARFTSRATQELLDPIANDPAKEGVRNALGKLIEGYQAYGPGGEAGPMSFSKAWELQTSLRKKLGLGDSLFAAREELPKLRQLFRDEIIDQAGDISPHFGEMLQGESRNYRSAEVVEQMARRAFQRQELNNPYSLFDRLAAVTAGAALGGPGGIAASAGAMLGNKLMRERGRSIVATLADKLASQGVVDQLANGLSKYVEAGLRTAPVWGGAFRATLERAFARGAEDLVATHVQLAKTDPSYLASVGLEDETPELANAAAQRADAAGKLKAVIGEHDARVEAALNRFLGKQGGALPQLSEPKVSADEFKSQLAQLQLFAANPQAMQAAVNPANAGDFPPALAALMASTGGRAIQYLQTVAPKPTNTSPVGALNNPWQPTQPQLARWGRALQAVQRPDLVVQHLRDGSVSKEELAAVSAVYPQLVADMQKKLVEKLSAHNTPLGYAQKLAISQLTRSPAGSAGNLQRLALLQTAHAVTVSPGPQASGRRMSAADGRQEVNTVSNYQTQTQRSEARASMPS